MKRSSRSALKLQAKFVLAQHVEYAEKLFSEDETILNEGVGEGRAGGEPPQRSQACPPPLDRTEDIPCN